jgi:trehalose 6-phosphate synthase/phosphatase
VNPYDIEGLSETIYKALNLPAEERKERMRKMRRIVRRYDVFWWVKAFLTAAISKELNDFPVVAEYIPEGEKL